jgi:hypothetical protein
MTFSEIASAPVRRGRTLAILACVTLISISGIHCGGGSSDKSSGTQTPTAPSRPAPAFALVSFDATFSQDASTHHYSVHLVVRESGGQAGGTFGAIDFTLMKDGTSLSTSSRSNVWQPAHLNGGGSMEARIDLTDNDLSRPIATRITAKINIVDDDQRATSLSGATDVPQPASTPTPPPPQPGTSSLACIVQDDATNAGLGDALVQIVGGASVGKSTTSAANGQCSLSGLTAGTSAFRVTRDGYQTLDKSVTLPTDTRVEFKLVSNAPPTPPGGSGGGNGGGGGGGGGGGSGSMICSAPVRGNSTCTTPTAQCNDGTPSCSQNRSGTCSSHGGVSCWVCPGPLCQ